MKIPGAGFNSNRLFLWGVLLVYISISHIFLPAFKVGRYSSLFFSTWNLFSFPPNKFIKDITWDGGQSFLFRDYRKQAVYSGVSIARIFFWFHTVRPYRKTMKLPKNAHEQILNFCKCQEFDVVLLKGSLFGHIIYKKQLEVLRRKSYKPITIKRDKIR